MKIPYTIGPLSKNQPIPSFHELLEPVYRILPHTPPLEAKGDRPLQMTFEHQLQADAAQTLPKEYAPLGHRNILWMVETSF